MEEQNKYMNVKIAEDVHIAMNVAKKVSGNRSVSLNRELTVVHKAVIVNLNSIHGALLCLNRGIQSEEIRNNKMEQILQKTVSKRARRCIS